MLLEDFGGERATKKDLPNAVLQIKEAMRCRLGWKKTVKNICKWKTPLPSWDESSSSTICKAFGSRSGPADLLCVYEATVGCLLIGVIYKKKSTFDVVWSSFV